LIQLSAMRSKLSDFCLGWEGIAVARAGAGLAAGRARFADAGLTAATVEGVSFTGAAVLSVGATAVLAAVAFFLTAVWADVPDVLDGVVERALFGVLSFVLVDDESFVASVGGENSRGSLAAGGGEAVFVSTLPARLVLGRSGLPLDVVVAP
jgi:hypothetical protein